MSLIARLKYSLECFKNGRKKKMHVSKAEGSLSAKDLCERGSQAFCRVMTHTKEADESF